MRLPITLTIAMLAFTTAVAANCDGNQMLQNNTPLSSLCPNGFGQFTPPGIEQAIQNQSSNVSMIEASAVQHGVPIDLALAVSYHESEGFKSCAGSEIAICDTDGVRVTSTKRLRLAEFRNSYARTDPASPPDATRSRDSHGPRPLPAHRRSASEAQ